MDIDIQDFVENQLNKVLNEAEEKLCSKYTAIFRKYQQKAETDSRSQEAFLYEILWNASSLEFSADKGDPLKFVSFNGYSINTIPIFTEDILKILVELLKFIDDPELSARVGDILWLKGIKKETHQFAQQAIKEYLASCQNLQHSVFITYQIERWRRGYRLAQQLNNTEQVQAYVSYLKSLFALHESDTAGYDLFHILTLFLEYRIDLDRSEEFIELLHKTSITAKQNGKWPLAEKYLELEGKWHQSRDNLEEYRQTLVLIAEIYEERAVIAAGEVPANYIAAQAFIENAIVVLRKVAGTRDLIARLHLLMDEYGRMSDSQMQSHSFPVEIQEDAVTEARNHVSGKSFEEALAIWAHLIPVLTKTDLRAHAEQSLSGSVYRLLYSSRTINNRGKVTSRQDNNDLRSEENLKEEMLSMSRIYQQSYVATYLYPALYQISLEHAVNEQVLVELFDKCPLIPSGHEHIYAKGLLAGLQGDGLIATHLLIPQIENSLREALTIYGKITSSLSADLIQEEFTLNRIIYMKELENIFGEDIMFNLQAILVEKQGSNLRNLMAHGLLDYQSFSSFQITYLTWLAFRLLYTPYHQMFPREDRTAQDDAT